MVGNQFYVKKTSAPPAGAVLPCLPASSHASAGGIHRALPEQREGKGGRGGGGGMGRGFEEWGSIQSLQ